jgi:hypothetical protein
MVMDVKMGQKPASDVNFVIVADQKPQNQPKTGFSKLLEPIEIDFVTRRS